MRPASRTNPKKIMQKLRNQTNEYYAGWVEAEKAKDHRNRLYNHSIKMFVDVVKEKNELKNRPVEIREVIKEVPFEVIREVPKEIIKEVVKIKEVPRDVLKIERVEVPVIKEVIKEVEILKEVKIPVEVIKEVPKIITKEVPREVIKEVIKEVPVTKEVEVFVDNPEVKKSYEKIIKNMEAEQKKDFKNLKEDFDTRIKLEHLSKKALEKRYQSALLEAREQGKRELMSSFETMDINTKKYKRLFTYAYITTMVALPTFLGLIVCGKYLF